MKTQKKPPLKFKPAPRKPSPPPKPAAASQAKLKTIDGIRIDCLIQRIDFLERRVDLICDDLKKSSLPWDSSRSA